MSPFRLLIRSISLSDETNAYVCMLKSKTIKYLLLEKNKKDF